MIEEFVRERITELRLRRNISERKLSEMLGHSYGYISQITSGFNMPSFSALEEICEFFNISMSEFFAGYKEKEPVYNEIVRLLAGTEHKEFLKNYLQGIKPEEMDYLIGIIKAHVEAYKKNI